MGRPKQDTVAINLRLPRALHAALKQKAEEQERSLNKQIVRALGVFMFGSQNAVAHPSKLPGGHPDHVCGAYCDGQDGSSSKCYAEKMAARTKPKRRRKP